jgi:hypothetical protein
MLLVERAVGMEPFMEQSGRKSAQVAAKGEAAKAA